MTDDADISRAWTSKKLSWLRGLAVDPEIPAGEFEAGFATIQHSDKFTGKAYVSDECLSDEVGCTVRQFRRYRSHLRATGWLTWTRTGSANVYTFLFDHLAEMTALLVEKKRKRDLRRSEGVRTNLSYRKKVGRTDSSPRNGTDSSGDRSNLTGHDRTDLSPIHVRDSTFAPTFEEHITNPEQVDRDKEGFFGDVLSEDYQRWLYREKLAG